MTDTESVILEELEHVAPLGGFENADWHDVIRRVEHLHARRTNLQRHRPARRRVLVGMVVVVVIVLVAGPALGFGRQFLDFWTSSRAPQRIVHSFAQMDAVGAPRGMNPRAVASETRVVTTYHLTDGTPFPLWVAPARDGGFCYLFKFGGGCTAPGDRVRPDGPGDDHAGLLNLGSEGNARLHLLIGDTYDQHIATLAVDYKNGTEASIPILWVGSPINAGFFFYQVPADQWASVVSVVARDSAGGLVARSASVFRPPPIWTNPLKVAVLSREHVILRSGELSISVAPSRTGGNCFWLRVGSQTISSGCEPPSLIKVPLAGGLNHGSSFTAYSAHAQSRVARVDLEFQDGTVVRLTPVDGEILYNIPQTHWPQGHRLKLVIVHAANGRIIQRVTVDPTVMGVYDCARPKPIGAGITECP
jgi:hypothetical protein